MPGVRMVLTSVGGSFLGGGQPGRAVRAPRAARGARLQLGAGLSQGSCALDPLSAFREQLLAGRRDAGGPRGACGSSRTCACSVRNIQSFNLGGGRYDLDFAIRGPELEALADYGERLRLKAPEIGIVDADTR